MFARSHLVQTTLAKINNSDDPKTDQELIREAEEEERRLELEEEEYDPDNYDNPITSKYVEISNLARELSKGKYEAYFNTSMIVVIMIAGVLVGIQTYDGMEGNEVINALENICLSAFIIEAIVKIVGEGLHPLHYFLGPEGGWNTFDLLVILVCLPFFTAMLQGKSQVIRMFSRLSRLVRASKIVHQVPALQVIITGLIGGLKSIMYIALLLSIVFYLYGVLGVNLYSLNDPFHFGDVPISIITLFRACTLDGWNVIFFIQAHGCENFNGGMYYLESDVTADEWKDINPIYKCTHPLAQPMIASMYFISFIVCSALVMLSLFVGIITMSMQQSLNDMRRSVEEDNRKSRLLKQTAELTAVSIKNVSMNHANKFVETLGAGRHRIKERKNVQNNVQHHRKQSPHWFSSSLHQVKLFLSSIHAWLYNLLFHEATEASIMSMKEARKLQEFKEMKALMMQAWGKSNLAEKYHEDLDTSQGWSLAMVKRRTSLLSHAFIESKYWTDFMTFVILCTAFVIGYETDNPSAPGTSTFIFYVVFENFIFSVFLIDLLGRMAIDEFIMKEYFKSGWNCFDFVIVVSSKIPGGGAIVNILRLLRLLRVLKLVKALPELQVIVNALIMGLTSIGYIGMIILLTFYLFSILALIIFGANDPFHFGKLHRSIFTLFDVATLDNWSDVMYIQIYGCDQFPSPLSRSPSDDRNCVDPEAMGFGGAIFFIFFVIVGAFIMLTLFVGVVTTSMEEAQQNQELEKNLEEKVRGLQKDSTITDGQLDIYRRVFAMLDLDGGGTIEKDELRFGLKVVDMNPSDEELDEWILKCDQNSDGVIDLIEFCVFMTHMQEITEMKRKEQDAINEAKRKVGEEDKSLEAKVDMGLGKRSMVGLKNWKNKALGAGATLFGGGDAKVSDSSKPEAKIDNIANIDTGNVITSESKANKSKQVLSVRSVDSDMKNGSNNDLYNAPQSDLVEMANHQYLKSMAGALERRKLGALAQPRVGLDISQVLEINTTDSNSITGSNINSARCSLHDFDDTASISASIMVRGKSLANFTFTKEENLHRNFSSPSQKYSPNKYISEREHSESSIKGIPILDSDVSSSPIPNTSGKWTKNDPKVNGSSTTNNQTDTGSSPDSTKAPKLSHAYSGASSRSLFRGGSV